MSTVVAAATGGFLAGAIVVAALVAWPPVAISRRVQAPPSVPAELTRENMREAESEPHFEGDPVYELRERHLELPVLGASRLELRESFSDRRGVAHHEAIDIMTPRNTPIVAVEDGTIARLFESKAGGHTVYQFDLGKRYAYYYAHLEAYADGLAESNRVQRGQVLGYAGTSGNAPPDTPHLHFAIFRLTEDKHWWQGGAIDPYEVLK